jgi:hypothetical protein
MKAMLFLICTFIISHARAEDAHEKKHPYKVDGISLFNQRLAHTSSTPTPWQSSWHWIKKVSSTCNPSMQPHRRMGNVEYVCDSQKALKKVERQNIVANDE